MTGQAEEYQLMIDVLEAADAELKIVIAGNHDITLDEDFYREAGKTFHPYTPEDLTKVRDMWTGWKAKQAGIIYLEEGTRTFQLRSGAKFTVGHPLPRNSNAQLRLRCYVCIVMSMSPFLFSCTSRLS